MGVIDGLAPNVREAVGDGVCVELIEEVGDDDGVGVCVFEDDGVLRGLIVELGVVDDDIVGTGAALGLHNDNVSAEKKSTTSRTLLLP